MNTRCQLENKIEQIFQNLKNYGAPKSNQIKNNLHFS
jgi:hypothetical protein